MEPRLTKPWRRLTAEAVARVPAQLGVYELGDDAGNVLYVGYAGGRSLFGLRSALQEVVGNLGGATQFRYEVNQQYMSRYCELVLVHQRDRDAAARRAAAQTPGTAGRRLTSLT